MSARAAFAAATVTALSACVHSVSPVDIGPYPERYDQLVSSFIDANFYDPASPKQIAVSTPRPRRDLVSGQEGWVVCVFLSDAGTYAAYGDLRVAAIVLDNGTARRGSYYLAEDCLTTRY